MHLLTERYRADTCIGFGMNDQSVSDVKQAVGSSGVVGEIPRAVVFVPHQMVSCLSSGTFAH